MPVKPTICQCHCYLHIIKLLKNTELKCTNNASHEVKEFCLLKRPMGMPTVGIARLHKAHGQCPPARPWAMSQSTSSYDVDLPDNFQLLRSDDLTPNLSIS
jgi:hypothetical protein